LSLPPMKNYTARRKNLAVLALASLLFAVPVRARPRHDSADYLLIEHVERLLLYNRYQQRMSPEERKLIAPFSPMKILDASAKLNDDFTPCTKVEIQGSVYYLMKDEKSGGLAITGNNMPGLMQVYKDAAVENDTVRLTAGKTKLISPDKTRTTDVQKGNFLERYFRAGGKTFVRLLGIHPEYGWVDFPDKNGYVVTGTKKEPDSDLTLSSAVQKRIQSRLFEANAALKELFAYFNSETNAGRNAPHWKFIVLERQYACVLEPEGYAEQYPESTRYLAGDIDNMLIGTNYRAAGSSGMIEIRQK
jgi:hypothetical protein